LNSWCNVRTQKQKKKKSRIFWILIKKWAKQ